MFLCFYLVPIHISAPFLETILMALPRGATKTEHSQPGKQFQPRSEDVIMWRCD